MEVRLKNILYQFIEGQTHHSGMLNERHKIGCSTSIQIPTPPLSTHHDNWKEIIRYCVHIKTPINGKS